VWFRDLMQDTKFVSLQAPPLVPSGPAAILCAQATQRNTMQFTTNTCMCWCIPFAQHVANLPPARLPGHVYNDASYPALGGGAGRKQRS
jgi:hypothetical protein